MESERANTKLRQLQHCEIDILDEFVRLCKKHELKYWLIAGTLLGAVRHKGFIPWDDDIDVAMPREDYDRFFEICKEELDPRYFYQTSETDEHYFLTYAKLRKKDTEVYEERFRDSKFYKGVFIDIFPLDFSPQPGALCHLLFNILAVMNYRGQIDSGEPYAPYKELIGKLGYFILRIFSPKKLVQMRRKLLGLSRWLSNKKYVASYSGAYGYYKDVYKFDLFGWGEEMLFEGKLYSIPSQYEAVLIMEFGEDFMTPPPEEKRQTHIDIAKSRL